MLTMGASCPTRENREIKFVKEVLKKQRREEGLTFIIYSSQHCLPLFQYFFSCLKGNKRDGRPDETIDRRG